LTDTGAGISEDVGVGSGILHASILSGISANIDDVVASSV